MYLQSNTDCGFCDNWNIYIAENNSLEPIRFPLISQFLTRMRSDISH